MTAVHRDEVRGHFVLNLAPRGHLKREAVGCDLGSVLHVTLSGAHLTPAEARTFAEALTWWADRGHAAVHDTERLVEINDLFDLIREVPDA